MCKGLEIQCPTFQVTSPRPDRHSSLFWLQPCRPSGLLFHQRNGQHIYGCSHRLASTLLLESRALIRSGSCFTSFSRGGTRSPLCPLISIRMLIVGFKLSIVSTYCSGQVVDCRTRKYSKDTLAQEHAVLKSTKVRWMAGQSKGKFAGRVPSWLFCTVGRREIKSQCSTTDRHRRRTSFGVCPW